MQVRQMPLVCPGHNRGIVELQYSGATVGGTFLISACLDGTPMLRDGVTGDWVGSFVGHKGAVWGACVSGDASLAATAGADFTARLWDAVTGECKAVLAQPHICKSTAFSADGSRLLTAGNHSEIRIYDVNAGDESPIALLQRADGVKRTVKAARYAGKGSNVVVACSSNTAEDPCVSVWDVRSGALERTLELSAPTKSAELSHDGEVLTVTSVDATMSIFSLEKMERIMKLPIPRDTESATLRYPQMDMMVTGGHDLTVRRYEVLDGGDNVREVESNRGHHGPVWVVRFAPDGESYASGSDDGTIRLWYVA